MGLERIRVKTRPIARTANGEYVNVQYEICLTNEGVGIIESVRVDRLRPYPEVFDACICCKDKVDVWMGGSWWVGECVSFNEELCNVRLEYMPDPHKPHQRKPEEVREILCSPSSTTMPSHKSFMIKKKLAKKMRQNRPIPHWIRMRTDNTIRYNAKRRHWRRTKLGF
ncbi:hypothetical protein LXL04_002785 [Taraxacum kok-saghyz]